MNTHESNRSEKCPSEVDLSAYVDGELSGDARTVIENHLATCARCRQYLGELQATFEALHHLFQRAADEMTTREVAHPIPITPISRRTLLVALAAAAACLVIGIAAWAWYYGTQSRNDRPKNHRVQTHKDSSSPSEPTFSWDDSPPYYIVYRRAACESPEELDSLLDRHGSISMRGTSDETDLELLSVWSWKTYEKGKEDGHGHIETGWDSTCSSSICV